MSNKTVNFIQEISQIKQRLNFVGPTSKVVTSYEKGDINAKWDKVAMLIPHEGFRFYSQLMNDAILNDKFNPTVDGNEWKMEYFTDFWLNWYWNSLHHHHNVEEQIMLPYLEKKVTIPPKLAGDHKDLIAVGSKIDGICKLYNTNKTCTDNVVDELKKLVQQFIDILDEHLKEEEIVVPQLINEGNITSKEFDDNVIVPIIKRSAFSKDLPIIVYVMYSWMGDDTEIFLNNIPAPIRILLQKRWLPRWIDNCLSLMFHIIIDQQREPQATSCVML